MGNEQNAKDNFRELLEECAGPDRKAQEVYLARVIMKVLIEEHGRGGNLPDANVFLAIGGSKDGLKVKVGDCQKEHHSGFRVCERDLPVVMKVLDDYYAKIAQLLLANASSCDLPGVRLDDIKQGAIHQMKLWKKWKEETEYIEKQRIRKGFYMERENKEVSK